MAWWRDEPPPFISIQTIVKGIFVPKETDLGGNWRDQDIFKEGFTPTTKATPLPSLKADEYWGTDQFPEMKDVTFDMQELERRSQRAAANRARREHGLEPLQ